MHEPLYPGAVVIDIYLYLGDLDKAWSVFVKEKDRFYMNEPPPLKLFERHEPARLIPLYRDLILKTSARGNVRHTPGRPGG